MSRADIEPAGGGAGLALGASPPVNAEPFTFALASPRAERASDSVSKGSIETDEPDNASGFWGSQELGQVSANARKETSQPKSPTFGIKKDCVVLDKRAPLDLLMPVLGRFPLEDNDKSDKDEPEQRARELGPKDGVGAVAS